MEVDNEVKEIDPNEIKVQKRKIKKIVVKKVLKHNATNNNNNTEASSSSSTSKNDDMMPIIHKPQIHGSTTGKESVKFDKRRIRVPVARFTPLKKAWEQLYKPIVEKMGLEIMFDPKNRFIDLRV